MNEQIVGAQAAGEPAIRIRGLRKAFGAQHVLRGLDLDVRQGQVTVVIGLSGAGKSVLLKLILGLLRPDAGTIEIDGTDILALPPRKMRALRRHFGMVFQHGALFDSMSIYENVAFPLREHEKLPEVELARRVFAALADVGLEGHEAKMPSALSGGMRKRASLARALVRNPRFLLYDEPTTGLDPIRTASIDRLIHDTALRHPEISSLVISHDMTATFRIADHVAMLYDGRIVAEGPPDVMLHHEDPLVQQFIRGELSGPIPT